MYSRLPLNTMVFINNKDNRESWYSNESQKKCFNVCVTLYSL